jgi:hypothetical protein
MSFGSWLSREFKLAEIVFINKAADYLNTALPQLEGLVDTNAPQTIQTAVNVVESADGKILGPLGAGLVNTALNSYESQLAPELEAAVASGGGTLLSNLVTAMRAVSSKLETEVEPAATTHSTAQAVAEPAHEPAPAAIEHPAAE